MNLEYRLAKIRGEFGLPNHNAMVLEMIWRGKQNKAIADELGLQVATVKSRIFRIYRTLGVDNRVGAALAVERMFATSTFTCKGCAYLHLVMTDDHHGYWCRHSVVRCREIGPDGPPPCRPDWCPLKAEAKLQKAVVNGELVPVVVHSQESRDAE